MEDIQEKLEREGFPRHVRVCEKREKKEEGKEIITSFVFVEDRPLEGLATTISSDEMRIALVYFFFFFDFIFYFSFNSYYFFYHFFFFMSFS